MIVEASIGVPSWATITPSRTASTRPARVTPADSTSWVDTRIRGAPRVKILWATLQQARDVQRLDRYLAVPGLLRDRGGLQRKQSDEDVAALIWNTSHPQTYRFLVTERSWTAERY